MRWDDDLLLTSNHPYIRLRGQWQLACYATHLGAGNSIYCKQIRCATVESYVLAASSLLESFTGADFRKDEPSDKSMGYVLGPVYRDLKSYESVPNRCEPYGHPLQELARTLAAQFPPDSLICALTDGFEQGFCAGYRLSEWAQPSGRTNPLEPQLNHLVSATVRTRAFVPNDFRVQTAQNLRAVGLRILDHPLGDLDRLWVTWRTQKNGDHGQSKLFTRNPSPGGICLVSAVYRSLERFARLMARDPRIHPAHTPLSIYWSPRLQAVQLVNSTDIETFMRRLAMAVHKLHPDHDAEEIRRWSSHSLRVGACVTLHAMGFSPLDIQWILRWRSMAFMVYLRNVALLARRHVQALNKAAAHPFL